MAQTRRKRPRNRPIVLDDITRRVLVLAKNAERTNAERLVFKRELVESEGHRTAKERVEDALEVRFTSLPYYYDLQQLAGVIDDAIFEAWNLHYEPVEMQPFVQRISLYNEGHSAFITIAPEHIALGILHLRYLAVAGVEVHLTPMPRPRNAVGSRATRRERGAADIPIHDVQVGQLDQDADGEPRFKYMWRSDVVGSEGECDDYDELPPSVCVQMVSRRIAITVHECHQVKAGEYKTGQFAPTMSPLRIEIPFLSIVQAATLHRAEPHGCHAVYIQLRHPPLLFREEFAARREYAWSPTNIASASGEAEEMRYVRTVDFTDNHAFARCRALRLFLNVDEGHFGHFCDILRNAKIFKHGAQRGLQLVPSHRVNLGVSSVHCAMRNAAATMGIPFAVRYEVACLLACGAVTESEVSDSRFWQLIAPLDKVDALRVLDMLHKKSAAAKDLRVDLRNELYYTINTVKSRLTSRRVSDLEEQESDDGDSKSGRASSSYAKKDAPEVPFNVPGVNAATQAILRDAQNTSDEPESKFVPIRRVMITPTRIVPCRADLDMLNRIIRQYYPHRERFIRVSFADEDSDSISHQGSGDIYTQVRQWLRDGVEVAGEKFVFLAFSSSQLRENGCWFYNETPGRGDENFPSVEKIRQSFGDLRNIKVASRYAARMGQVFSATVQTLEVPKDVLIEEGDIWNEDKKYRFSDGVGMMCEQLADAVKDKLQLKGNTPSAFQVRYAGAKGVLSVWPKVPIGASSSKQMKMVIRKSMLKFPSTHRMLEVVGYSKKLPFFLNRQVIMILECLGVPKETFVQMQVDYLKEIDACMEANSSKASVELLTRTGWGGGRAERDHKFCNVGSMVNPMQLFRAGLTCGNCEFLHEVMFNYRRKVISNVRSRACIPIQQALNGIGVLDEAGVLDEGELYCAYTAPDDKAVAITGDVIVGRQPCMHPGDLQKVKAVDRPELHHLVDVVVFSKKGPRPLPSMLSGGDLDGDLYYVIWDKRLLCTNSMHQPMKYEAVEERKVANDFVTIDDVQNFMVAYMAEDTLGKIANAHMVHSDKKGIDSKDAKHLAYLHSVAVDFAKTGNPAIIPRELLVKGNEKNAFPDYMGKPMRVSYESQRALGLMYRIAMGGEWKLESPKFDPRGAYEVDRFFDSYQAIDPDLQEEAWALCESWNTQVREFMTLYGVETEAELVSGQVVTFSTHSTNPSYKRKHAEQLQSMNRYMKQLRKTFLEAFYEDTRSEDDDEAPELSTEHVLKAVAWYRAARKVADADRRVGKTPMHSFPFVVSNILIQIVANGFNQLKKAHSESSVNADSEDAELDGSENSQGDADSIAAHTDDTGATISCSAPSAVHSNTTWE